jgi:hypothetical protein
LALCRRLGATLDGNALLAVALTGFALGPGGAWERARRLGAVGGLISGGRQRVTIVPVGSGGGLEGAGSALGAGPPVSTVGVSDSTRIGFGGRRSAGGITGAAAIRGAL